MEWKRKEWVLFVSNGQRSEEEMYERKRKIILWERERENELVEKRNIVMLGPQHRLSLVCGFIYLLLFLWGPTRSWKDNFLPTESLIEVSARGLASISQVALSKNLISISLFFLQFFLSYYVIKIFTVNFQHNWRVFLVFVGLKTH